MDKKRIAVALTIGTVLITLFTTVPCQNIFGLVGLLFFAGFGTWELYGLLESGGLKPLKSWGTAFALLFTTATWFTAKHQLQEPFLWGIATLFLLLQLTLSLRAKELKAGLSQALSTSFGFFYIPLLWSFVVRLFLSGELTQPGWAAFYTIICMKAADSGGYFAGMRFGKRKLAPVISPKKTWEGLWGGIVFCVLLNWIWVLVSRGHLNSTYSLNLFHATLLGILFPVVGTLGDLVESLIKRAVQVKDSNQMVYGLGGILDMIDSILFTAPLLYFYAELFLR